MAILDLLKPSFRGGRRASPEPITANDPKEAQRLRRAFPELLVVMGSGFAFGVPE
jgi:hypothetical protein